MTVGTLTTIIILTVLFCIWGFNSIKDLCKNGIRGIHDLSLFYFCLIIAVIIAFIPLILITYWNYKLF